MSETPTGDYRYRTCPHGALYWMHCQFCNPGGAVLTHQTFIIDGVQPSELDRLRKENAALRAALRLIESAICSDARSVVIARAALQGAKE